MEDLIDFDHVCKKCNGPIFWMDKRRCRNCDPIERINARAEISMRASMAARKDDMLMLMQALRWRALAFAEAADIVMESNER